MFGFPRLSRSPTNRPSASRRSGSRRARRSDVAFAHLFRDSVTRNLIRSRLAVGGLANAEYQQPGAFAVGFEDVPGLADQIGNIDRGQGIGAFEHQRVARGEPTE